MPQPGLEPGPSDPESSTLTTGLLTPHMYSCICRERAEKRKKKGIDRKNMKDKRGEGIKRRIKI